MTTDEDILMMRSLILQIDAVEDTLMNIRRDLEDVRERLSEKILTPKPLNKSEARP